MARELDCLTAMFTAIAVASMPQNRANSINMTQTIVICIADTDSMLRARPFSFRRKTITAKMHMPKRPRSMVTTASRTRRSWTALDVAISVAL